MSINSVAISGLCNIGTGALAAWLLLSSGCSGVPSDDSSSSSSEDVSAPRQHPRRHGHFEKHHHSGHGDPGACHHTWSGGSAGSAGAGYVAGAGTGGTSELA